MHNPNKKNYSKKYTAKAEPVRLNKFIASAGVASRRGADELIFAGKIKINGKIVTEPGTTVTPQDKIEVNGKPISAREKKYVIFYKPAGYISTCSDPQDRRTIYNLLPPELQHLKSAGRLDKDSSGLLLLTNDGELILKLTHPRVHIPKVYRVVVEGKVTQTDMETLQKGIEIEPGKIAYAESIMLDYEQGKSTLNIILYQGYNRQIRRMMEHLQHPVISLKRTAQGCLELAGLDKGRYRYLSSKEVVSLFNYIKNMEKATQSKLAREKKQEQ